MSRFALARAANGALSRHRSARVAATREKKATGINRSHASLSHGYCCKNRPVVSCPAACHCSLVMLLTVSYQK
jgi:hypothetical protein